ncbi:MAG: hypothetical protein HY507_00710 [Candidatus Zambryskibacteria bacterium]|nr:hypothetical protein [Candidatus Zambryskibacteria bacterium]
MVWWVAKLKNQRMKILDDLWVEFILCWMIFDAYLTEISKSGTDRKKLDYFYQNDSELKSYMLSQPEALCGYGETLKTYELVVNMRPGAGDNAGKVVMNTESLEEILEVIYQIRCNLFHGSKNIKNSRDYELVKIGKNFLRRFFIDTWMTGI